MLRKVLSFVKKHHMIEQGDHILAGVSGGADSVCLLLVLKELQKEFQCRITVLHVEHGIRGEESRQDQEFVENLCKKLGITCMVHVCDAISFSEQEKMSLEEGAREIRYQYFGHMLEELRADKIAIAHNRNDCAETLLFQMVRGSGLRGMCGITPKRDRIIRPLLCLGREEIERWLEGRKQEYCVDATNEDVAYSRNKIRHQVMPLLTEINDNATEHLYRSTEYVSQALEVVEQLTTVAKRACVKGNVILKEELGNYHPFIQKNLILELLYQVATMRKDITENHVNQVCDLLEKQSGKRVILPYGMQAQRVYEGVRILKTEEMICAQVESGALEVGTTQEINGISICSCILEKTSEHIEIPQKKYTKWFDYDTIKDTLVLRTRCEGDYFSLDAQGKTQSLKKYFINEKIPSEERSQVLLLTEGAHVLWAVGYRISEAYKVTEKTKRILEIQVSGGEQDE